jgi:hypothetical protein
LVSGDFRPSNLSTIGAPDTFPSPATTDITNASLAEFNGGNPNGTWSLFIVDDTTLDGGSIGGWSLTITARIRVKARSKPKPGPKAGGGNRH